MNIRLAKSIGYILLPWSLGAGSVFAADEDHDFEALQQAEDQWQFVENYCTDCHNFEDYSGGLDLSTLFPEDVPQNAATFEQVLRKLRGHMMPPIQAEEKPSENRREEFVAWLETYLDEAGSQTLEPQNVALHRLNRKEYANAIERLVGLKIDPATVLPEDNVSDGFDNVAEALQVSPSFVDQYISAARSIMEKAVGDRNPSLGSTIYTPSEAGPQRAVGGGSQQFHIDGMPLGTRGGLLVEHWFPADGEYSISIGDLAQALWVYNLEFRNDIIVTLDGEKIYETSIGGGEDLKGIDQEQDPVVDAINERLKDIRFTTTAGPHKVGVTFRRRTFAESDDRLQPFIEGAVQDRILSISSFEIRGPYNPAGLSETPSRDKIFTCYPESVSEEEACARQIIRDFASRAYRRPVDEADTRVLFDFYERGYERDGFEEGIRQALTRVLASPNFLYRAEETPPDMEPGRTYQLSSVDLASRLSFFLWSSLPDEELLMLAEQGKLQDPDVLNEQIERMLADPRSRSLASNFAYQWLHLSKLDEINPDEATFPYASGAGDPRSDYKKEIELFFNSIVKEDHSVLRLLDADWTFVNEKIASLYDIRDVKGNHFRRVELEDPSRFGLLGKGGILMATSYPNRTSPVLRGAYILETIMGTPMAAPPPDVEDLAENEPGQPASTVRERLERHRDNPGCASCHAVMDPLGFALDNFDAVGQWRERDRFANRPINASAELPDGQPIEGPGELRRALLNRPDLFIQTMTEKLMTFALGRTLTAQDMPTVRAIVDAAEEDNYRFSSIVKNIVNSHQFQMRKATEVSGSGDESGESEDIALHH